MQVKKFVHIRHGNAMNGISRRRLGGLTRARTLLGKVRRTISPVRVCTSNGSSISWPKRVQTATVHVVTGL